MEDLSVLIGIIVDIMKIDFVIWGFTLSFWDIMLYLLVSGVVLWIMGGFFRGR